MSTLNNIESLDCFPFVKEITPFPRSKIEDVVKQLLAYWVVNKDEKGHTKIALDFGEESISIPYKNLKKAGIDIKYGCDNYDEVKPFLINKYFFEFQHLISFQSEAYQKLFKLAKAKLIKEGFIFGENDLESHQIEFDCVISNIDFLDYGVIVSCNMMVIFESV